MKVKKKKYISAIFCLLGFIMCIISGTFATVNAAGNASLTLNCVKDGEVITGMEWQIYQVAENPDKSDGKPVLTQAFQKYRRYITLGDGSLSDMAQLASTLRGYTLKGKIKPTQTSVSDGEGKAKFSNLEYGYYLIVAKKFKKGVVAWESEPLLVILTQDEDYQLDAFPKMNYITLDANEIQYTVKKVWANDENQPWLRSVYITAELYCDGEYDSSVRLDQSNDWTYSWTAKPDEDWVVVEQEVPENYVVTFRKQGVEYVIVNTYDTHCSLGGSGSWGEPKYPEETTTTIATTTTPHETDGQFTGNETTTSKPSQQITSEKETSTTEKTQHSEEISSTTSSTAESGSDFDTSSTSSTSTSTTTTTRTPSGNGSSNTYGGGSSSSSRYSSGGSSSGSYNNSGSGSNSGSSSGSKSGSGNASSITKLPQTGQLWWPVVPLAVGGILMMGIGLKLKEKD